MINYETRYPEAVALPSIETECTAEALVEMFSRDGWMDGYFVYRRSTLKGHIASNKMILYDDFI